MFLEHDHFLNKFTHKVFSTNFANANFAKLDKLYILSLKDPMLKFVVHMYVCNSPISFYITCNWTYHMLLHEQSVWQTLSFRGQLFFRQIRNLHGQFLLHF